MITPNMMKKDTVIEFVEDVIDTMYHQNSLLKGQQFLVKDKMSKQGGTALIAHLKNIKTGSEHSIFWVFIKPRIKIISSVEENKEIIIHTPSDIALNENEEYVVVHKNKPDFFYKTTFYQGYNTLKEDEFLEGSAIFTAKKGYRKKYKNRQSLNAFLSGVAGGRDWTVNQQTPLEQIYHISGFFAKTPDYFETSYPKGFSTTAKDFFILKKYNKDTKKLYSESVNFSIKDYLENIEKKLQDTFNYGEAVSQVLGDLRSDKKLEDYPFIFSVKYNANDYEKELQRYIGNLENIPRDKDIFFELLIKEGKAKKKDLFFYNKNGFAAIACNTKEMLEYYEKGYLNPMKVVNIYNTKEI